MDTCHRPPSARKFVGWGLAVSLGLFGLFRLPWIESHVVLPFTLIQGDLAAALFGAPSLPIAVTLACSGADALALCLGAVLAYPAPWRARAAGAAGGLVLILALNTLRIGSLGLVAASPAWFVPLHLYGWPALLTLAIAGYVFSWMRRAERPGPSVIRATPAPHIDTQLRATWQPSRRFILLTAALVIAFAATSPFYLESASVLAIGGVIAGAAAAILDGLGIAAHASANLLTTSRGNFVVTQECVATPLIPVYLAAVGTYAATWRRVVLGVLATLPLFTLLGIVRLLLVAVPESTLSAPTFLVHAFYQLLLGAVAVLLAAKWRHRGRAASTYAVMGLAAGGLVVFVLGPAYTRVVARSGYVLDDPQGAVAFLPAFQVGLYVALSVATSLADRWTRLVAGLGLLTLTQVAGLFALYAWAATGFVAQVRDVRAWAVAAPVLIFATVVIRGRTSR